MTAIGRNLTLVAFREPVVLQGLVGTNHGLVLKQQVLDLPVYKLFLILKKLKSAGKSVPADLVIFIPIYRSPTIPNKAQESAPASPR
ncbi:hypothetical protein D3C73_1000000 [compost metagenome]